MPDDRGSDNVFVRFKNQVDSQISSAYQGFQSLGFPSEEMHRDTQHAHLQRYNANVQYPLQKRPSPAEAPQDPRVFSHFVRWFRIRSIDSWVNFSAYSPHNLQHLQQPIPRDAPSGSTERFGFHDAFEDLLAVSFGQPLQDMESLRIEKRDRFFQGFHSSEDLLLRLEHRKLWEAFFPSASLPNDVQNILAQAEEKGNKLFGGFNEGDSREINRYKWCFFERAAMCHEERAQRMLGNGIVERFDKFRGFPHWSVEIGHSSPLLRKLDELYNPWVKSLDSTESQDHTPPLELPKAPEPELREPETAEDLYLAIKSEFSHTFDLANAVSKSFSQLWKILNGNVTLNEVIAGPDFDNLEPCNAQSTETTVSPDGSKVVKTVERQTDNGMTRMTVTKQKFDAAGNPVWRTEKIRQYSTNFTKPDGRTSAGRVQICHDDNEAVKPGVLETTDSVNQRAKSRNGWFWTRWV